MQESWYTLRALSREWQAAAVGSRLVDLYSGRRDELTLVTDAAGAFRISVRAGDRYLFRQDGAARPRKNVVTLFDEAQGRLIESIRVADRDRVLDFELSGGWLIRATLYGARANIYLAEDGVLREAFRRASAENTLLPEPQSAARVDSLEAFAARWPLGAQEPKRALARALPLVDRDMAAEILAQAQIEAVDACLLDASDMARLFEAAKAFEAQLEHPAPCIYWTGRRPTAFSLVPLAAPPTPKAEPFATVDEAVRVYVKARLADAAFRSEYEPLCRVAGAMALRNRTRADRMQTELRQPSRADLYERYGHLLMADPTAVDAGADRAVVSDLFADGAPVEIKLDPARTAVENAERYYEKARRTRRSRETATARLHEVQAAQREAEQLLAELEAVDNRADLRDVRKRHTRLLDTATADTAEVPFRRFDLGGGYEVWVGRNAKQNDALTFKHARKHDYWLHARGVAGSHTVLRRPNKTERAPAPILETAASIAAHHSKARGSGLVPVILTERKYVRKARKGPPGAVLVEREEVLIVPPGLPPGYGDN